MRAAPPIHLIRRTGYSNALLQPSVQMSVVVECPRSIAFPSIDDWLENALDLEIPRSPRLAVQPKSGQEVIVAGLVWRVMNLSAGLLQAIRVPVFDPGKILALRRRPSTVNQWDAVIANPRIDHLAIDPYELAWKAAGKVLLWIVNRPRTPENTTKLFAYLNDQFVGKFPLQINGGESTIAVLREAWNLGIEFRHLGGGTYQLGLGANQLRVDRGATQFDSAIGGAIAQNKLRSATLLRDAGLPAPTHLLAESEEAAATAARQLGWPVVVKPVDRDRGEGVSVNIRSAEDLSTAFRKARALSNAVLVEKQVTGVCHRVLVAKGKVCVVAKRLPKSVKGDGIRTVRELVDQANAEENARPPWTRLKPFPVDEFAVASLAAVNLNLDSVPAAGVLAPLRPIQTSEWGGVVENFTDRIHPDNSAIAVKAARLFGLSVAGIDIISSDITQSWRTTGAIINEVNFSPLLAGRLTGPAIATMIDGMIANRGRIPTEVVLGDSSALAEGLIIQSTYADRGVRCWLVTDKEAITDTGEVADVVAGNLCERCLAVLMDPQVEALVIVVQSDELLHTGLPCCRIDRVHEAFKEVSQTREHSKLVTDAPRWAEGVRQLLYAHLEPANAQQSAIEPQSCS